MSTLPREVSLELSPRVEVQPRKKLARSKSSLRQLDYNQTFKERPTSPRSSNEARRKTIQLPREAASPGRRSDQGGSPINKTTSRGGFKKGVIGTGIESMLTYTDALEDGTVEEVHEEGESFTEKVRKSDPFKIIKLPLALIGIELASLWIVLTLVLHRDYYLRPFPLNSISKDFLTEKSAPTPTDINKTILEIQYRTQTYVPWELIGEENTAYSVPNDADTWTTLNTSTMVHWRKDGKGGEQLCYQS